MRSAMTDMMKPNCNRGACKNLDRTLRALDFAIQETVLYLNAYPDCREALNYYHELIGERAKVLCEYQKQCGPVTMYGNTSTSSWDWTSGPWPWEADAN